MKGKYHVWLLQHTTARDAGADYGTGYDEEGRLAFVLLHRRNEFLPHWQKSPDYRLAVWNSGSAAHAFARAKWPKHHFLVLECTRFTECAICEPDAVPETQYCRACDVALRNDAEVRLELCRPCAEDAVAAMPPP